MKLIVIRVLTAVAVLGAALVAPSTAHAAGQLYQPYCDFKPGYLEYGEARHTFAHGVDTWLIGITQPPRATYLMSSMWIDRTKYCQIGKTLLVQQQDGNLVVYDEFNNPRWATSWFATPMVINYGRETRFQSDGNLVQYADNNRVLWASNTQGPTSGCYNACLTRKLAIQADGNVVIYDGNTVLWETKTYHN